MEDVCNGRKCAGCEWYTGCRAFKLDPEHEPYFSNEPLPFCSTCGATDPDVYPNICSNSFHFKPTDPSFTEMYESVKRWCRLAELEGYTITNIRFLEEGYEVKVGIPAGPDNWYGRRVPDPHTVDGIHITYYILGEES